MTREEAIQVLNMVEAHGSLVIQAKEMAIKALEQKLKTGHWILLDECSNSGYYCSECHKKVVKEGWSDTVKKVKYCPNCGAKMEDGDEEDKDSN